MKLAIFPGHIGKDSGAIDGTNNDTLYSIESVIVAGIVSKIETLLKLLERDYITLSGSWQDRIEKSRGCDFGISIHVDTSPSKDASGYHVMYYPGSSEGKTLACYIENCMYETTHNQFRNSHDKNLYILRKTNFPCVLIECGFISNMQDEINMHTSQHQWNIAMGIVFGVILYH